ncbi:MAG: hypothetical protein BJ554DRAFT_6551, partial [Olpidium bornovanus]
RWRPQARETRVQRGGLRVRRLPREEPGAPRARVRAAAQGPPRLHEPRFGGVPRGGPRAAAAEERGIEKGGLGGGAGGHDGELK